MRELRALTAVDRRAGADRGVDSEHLRCLVGRLAAAGRLRPHWSADDAVDALALLTSYSTYERLRGPPLRTPTQIEALLAKLAVSIVAPEPGAEFPGVSPPCRRPSGG